MKVIIKKNYYRFPKLYATGDLIGTMFIGSNELFIVKVGNEDYLYFPEDLIYDPIED